MQQVGDDEEFLRELLNDLRIEIETQLGHIAAIIQVRSCCRFSSGAVVGGTLGEFIGYDVGLS